MTDAALLVLHVRPGRARARATAEAEALGLLRDLGAQHAPGGPLSDRGRVFWLSLPTAALERATALLPHLGYTHAVDLVERVPIGLTLHDDVVLWHRQPHRLVRLYEESPEVARDRAPDRRAFALETKTGAVRHIRGYRGDSRAFKRRGLPAYDARMLVNIANATAGATFLDPFAGVGGVVVAAAERGCRVVSCDVDPVLRFGLGSLAAHVVADARRLPFAEAKFDAIATEPPYEPEAAEMAADSVREAVRVLRSGGRLSVFCAAWQGDALRQAAERVGMALIHEEAIDRKGVACAVLAWAKG